MKPGLFATFARLAEPPEPQTGAWRISTDSGRDGVVLMEAGRICWANYALSARLSEQIEQRYGISHATIEGLIRDCRETHRPFGASLIEQGHVTQSQLTSVLREHTCHSILSLVRAGVRDCEWIPHQGAGYAPETTISVAQAACSCVALAKGVGPEVLEASLETMVAGDAAGVLIHATSRLPFASTASPVSWQELRSWLAWTLRTDSLYRLPAQSYLTGRSHDGGWVMWRGGSMVGLAVTASDDAQRRLLLRVSLAIADWKVELPD